MISDNILKAVKENNIVSLTDNEIQQYIDYLYDRLELPYTNVFFEVMPYYRNERQRDGTFVKKLFKKEVVPNRDCYEYLRCKFKVSCEIKDIKFHNNTVIVTVRGITPDGICEEAIGCSSLDIQNKEGNPDEDAISNAIMIAETKAKKRISSVLTNLNHIIKCNDNDNSSNIEEKKKIEFNNKINNKEDDIFEIDNDCDLPSGGGGVKSPLKKLSTKFIKPYIYIDTVLNKDRYKGDIDKIKNNLKKLLSKEEIGILKDTLVLEGNSYIIKPMYKNGYEDFCNRFNNNLLFNECIIAIKIYEKEMQETYLVADDYIEEIKDSIKDSKLLNDLNKDLQYYMDLYKKDIEYQEYINTLIEIYEWKYEYHYDFVYPLPF